MLYCRTSIYNQSFFPSSLKLWNNLPNHIRETDSLTGFKSHISARKVKAPNYFSAGNRKLNIIHTQLRYSNSRLNADLYKFGLIENPYCCCKFDYENSYHYFMNCVNYSDIREEMVRNINKILDDKVIVTLDLLLNGNADLTYNENIQVFNQVQRYIYNSKRFNN